jgi:hypothetical protein
MVEIEADEMPLGEKEKRVPGFVGVGVGDTGTEEVVGPKANVSFMLFLEEDAADAVVDER